MKEKYLKSGKTLPPVEVTEADHLSTLKSPDLLQIKVLKVYTKEYIVGIRMEHAYRGKYLKMVYLSFKPNNIFIDYYCKDRIVVLHSGSREYYQDTSMILEPNEHIVSVTCISDHIGVIGIKFLTNKGKTMDVHGEKDIRYAKTTTVDFSQNKQVVCGLKTKFQGHLVYLA